MPRSEKTVLPVQRRVMGTPGSSSSTQDTAGTNTSARRLCQKVAGWQAGSVDKGCAKIATLVPLSLPGLSCFPELC